MDRGAWQATVHGVSKNQTRLKQLGTHNFANQLFLPATAVQRGSGQEGIAVTLLACHLFVKVF